MDMFHINELRLLLHYIFSSTAKFMYDSCKISVNNKIYTFVIFEKLCGKTSLSLFTKFPCVQIYVISCDMCA